MDTHDHDPLFDALRADMKRLDAPRGTEQALMQAFARQFPRKRRWFSMLTAWPSRAWALAASLSSVATAVLLFAFLVYQPRPGTHARPLAAGDGIGSFIALASLDRIEREPNPRMVETEVPRASLAPLGVPLTPENAGQTVKAEMLVAADGEPLALRLSSID